MTTILHLLRELAYSIGDGLDLALRHIAPIDYTVRIYPPEVTE
jgi:hypothetical protein